MFGLVCLVGEIHIFGSFDLGRMFAVGYVSMDTSSMGCCFEEILGGFHSIASS